MSDHARRRNVHALLVAWLGLVLFAPERPRASSSGPAEDAMLTARRVCETEPSEETPAPPEVTVEAPPVRDPDPALTWALSAFEEAYGVKVRFGDPDEVLRTRHYFGSALAAQDRRCALGLAEEVVRSHPPGLVASVVDEIVFVDWLADAIGRVGGIAGARQIVVSAHACHPKRRIVASLQHELGHRLHTRITLDEDRWIALSGRPYHGETSATYREEDPFPDSFEELEALLGGSYVSPYASSAFGEDVAESFKACMWPWPRRVARFGEPLWKKIELLEAAVQRVEPAFRCPVLHEG